jgi:hypothetical protein
MLCDDKVDQQVIEKNIVANAGIQNLLLRVSIFEFVSFLCNLLFAFKLRQFLLRFCIAWSAGLSLSL